MSIVSSLSSLNLTTSLQSRNAIHQTYNKKKPWQESNSNKTHRGIIHSLRATGNNVSHSRRHTRRVFRPNVFWRRLYSEVLDKQCGPMHVSATALRDIDKCGGLDNYVLKNPYKRIHWTGKILEIKNEIETRVKLVNKFGEFVPKWRRDYAALEEQAIKDGRLEDFKAEQLARRVAKKAEYRAVMDESHYALRTPHGDKLKKMKEMGIEW
jgi:large subunit ribosomal protein L28